ncbi:MAG: hypothetical protein PHV34_10880 [Verrucomicrobiae bacterium]|nr:hypothetical protein [Verrucomicrobiae bacterium]
MFLPGVDEDGRGRWWKDALGRGGASSSDVVRGSRCGQTDRRLLERSYLSTIEMR